MLEGKILVTGAGGFIGSHLVEALARMGCQVRAFVRYNSRGSWGWLEGLSPDLLPAVEIFAGDIRDPYGLRQAARGCDTIFHLAALIAIPYSYHSPDSYVETNVRGTLNILQAARELEVRRIVCTSTSEVYGTAQYAPIDEGHPLQAQSPYAASKIAADQLALSFHRSFDLPVVLLRPFNTYGPRQSARAIIPTILAQILSGKKTLTLGALHPTRDFNYVADTVQGFVAAATHNAAVGQVINLGGSCEITIGDLARLIAGLVGEKIEIQTGADRLRPEKSEVERLWADASRARSLLDWSPAYAGVAGLQRGIQETIAWFRRPENLNLYRPGQYQV